MGRLLVRYRNVQTLALCWQAPVYETGEFGRRNIEKPVVQAQGKLRGKKFLDSWGQAVRYRVTNKPQ
jgi:hypothetical protein